MTLGETLKRARQAKTMSLRQVEKAAQISNGYLSLLESDDVKQPSPHHLLRLAETYELDYAELMALAGYPVPRLGHHGELPAAVPRGAGLQGARTYRSSSLKIGRHETPSFGEGDLTPEEREKVEEYIAFLRSRRGGEQR